MKTIQEMLDALRFMLCVKFVVLTGGPCGGKSTILKMFQDLLEKYGYKVVVVPEVARELIGAGFNPGDTSWKTSDSFQEQVLLAMLEKESRYVDALKSMDLSDQQVVVLCDRGLMDGEAYVGKEQFREILIGLGIDPAVAMHRYDLVVHLVTAADGAEDFYVTDTVRRESPEEARALDKRTLSAWTGHPHHIIVGNDTDFSGKINNALLALQRKLKLDGNTPRLAEKKYWVMYADASLIPQGSVALEVKQTYLDMPGKIGIECRVRCKSVKGGSNTFYYNERTSTETEGVRGEFEEEITEDRYHELILAYKITECSEVIKTRYKFPHGGNMVDLDIFHGHLQGLVIMEIKVKSPGELTKVSPPAQFEVIDVTSDERFSNRSLAEHGIPPVQLG